jgi:hypothetical protein
MFPVLAPLLFVLLPLQLAPPPPFPQVIDDAPLVETIAPGVQYGTYDFLTQAGPIVVHVVGISPGHSDIRVDDVLSDNALVSGGETLSSMAHRTGAVAGINGDYFDIGNTNQPTNVVVQSGVLLETPRKRYALVITNDGLPQIVELSFLGTVQIGARSVGLDAVNVVPAPNQGVTLLTPQYGWVAPSDDTTLVGLQPTSGTPPFGSYRVTNVLDNLTRQPPGYYLAIGLGAYDAAGVPNPGDPVVVQGDLSPLELSNVAAAIGGGPLILRHGAWYNDPDGPTGGEFLLPIPASGAAIAPDGTLFLVEVDGRQPDVSVGVTRPALAAIMIALGATRGMSLDGGGSSEMVARTLGETNAGVVTSPSDGRERKIADALMIYSTAATGPPSRIVAIPGAVRAMPGASVSVRLATLDDAEHVLAAVAPTRTAVEPASLGTFTGGVFVASEPGDGAIDVRSGTLTLQVPVHVVADPARVVIVPPNPNAPENGSIALRAQAFDAHGYPIALPPDLPWRATNAQIDRRGVLTTTTQNALVSLLLGNHLANARVTVGWHDVALPFAQNARFMTMPRGGAGDVSADPACAQCIALDYALGPSERAAYAVANIRLPRGSLGVAFDVNDDASGAQLKLALRNAIDEEVLLSAIELDRHGWRRVVVRFPDALAQPARLVAIYVIGPNARSQAAGRIVLKDVHAVVAGQEQ